MPVAFDAVTSSRDTSVSSKTLSHTCTGSNRLLTVGVTEYYGASTTAQCTGITYAGTALTLSGTRARNIVGAVSAVTELWYLINPASGANNIVVTLNATADDLEVGGTSFTGANQTTGVNGYQSATVTTGATIAITITTGASGDMTVSVCGNWWDGGATTNQTSRWSQHPAGDTHGGHGDTAPGAASVTHTWTRTAADDDIAELAGVNIIAAAEAQTVGEMVAGQQQGLRDQARPRRRVINYARAAVLGRA